MLTYTDLVRFDTFEDRLEYLRLTARPFEETFRSARPLNQRFYTSKAWRAVRDKVLARDLYFDLGVPGQTIHDGRFLVHHMNPIRPKDLYLMHEDILDPEYLITVSYDTHQAIHYGSDPNPQNIFVERKPNDTRLW